MFKFALTILLSIFTILIQAQNKEQGYYKLSRAKKNANVGAEKSRLEIQFIGPTGRPVTSLIKFSMNGDSIVPIIDETGTYQTTVKTGTYQFNFIAPWWYNVATDSILLKPQTTTKISVYFEAKEFILRED